MALCPPAVPPTRTDGKSRESGGDRTVNVVVTGMIAITSVFMSLHPSNSSICS